MRTRSKVAITLGILLLIAGVAAADALTKEQSLTGQLNLWLAGEDEEGAASSSVASEGAQTSSAVSSENAEPAVLQTLIARGFTFEKKDDPSFLRQLLPTATVPTYVLLQNGDRAGALSWVNTAQSSQAFQSLKESLLQSFSPALQDLRDETVAEEGKPVRSVLTFFDPALSEERLVFVKSGDTLFEVHITESKRDAVLPLIDELSAQ